jgi:integrase/recombinase XerD
MLKENSVDLERFCLEGRANELAESTLKGYRYALRSLDESLDKPFKEASREDMMRFFNELQQHCKRSTVHLWKGKIKRFYNWLFNLAPREYPDCVKWVRASNPSRGSKAKGYEMSLSPEDLLSKEDVKLLIDACDNARDQALIAVMYETACEPMEALNLNVKSVQFDEQGAVVTLKGNTGERRFRVVNAVPYLQVWLNVHPLKKQGDAPLWTVQKGRPQRLGYAGLYRLTKRLKQRTGIKKPLRPNFLRHASLTEWAKILPEQKLKVLAGWTPSSRMAAVYIHLAGKDLDEDILKAHGIEVEKKPQQIMESLKPRVCPRCGHESPATYLWCGRCGLKLDVELDETKRLERDRFLDWFAEEAMKDRPILERWYKASDKVQERERKAEKKKPSKETMMI